MRTPLLVLPILPFAFLAACVEEPVNGREAYLEDCSTCHGTDARGTGSFGRQLIKEPPDLTRIAARAGGVFDRDAVMSVIDGLDRGAHFSGAMPEFGAGDMGEVILQDDGDHTVPVPRRLLALVDYLESIQR